MIFPGVWVINIVLIINTTEQLCITLCVYSSSSGHHIPTANINIVGETQ